MDGLRNIQDEKFIYIYIYIKHCLHFITNSLLTFSQMLQTYLRYAHAFFQVPNWGGGGGAEIKHSAGASSVSYVMIH